MRVTLALAAMLYSAAALAQSSAPPPADTARPAVEAKSAEAKSAEVKSAEAKSAKPSRTPKAKGSIAVRLEACQDIEDGTKGRLDCYDDVIKPAPKPNPAAAKTVMECKYTKEEDARLACYNNFVDMMPRLPKGS